MSTFISTKTPCQCRSHHQKFFKKTLDKILDGKVNEQDIQYHLIQDSIKNMFTQKKRIKKTGKEEMSPTSQHSKTKSIKVKEEEPKKSKRQSA